MQGSLVDLSTFFMIPPPRILQQLFPRILNKILGRYKGSCNPRKLALRLDIFLKQLKCQMFTWFLRYMS